MIYVCKEAGRYVGGLLNSDVINIIPLVTNEALVFQGELRPGSSETAGCGDPLSDDVRLWETLIYYGNSGKLKKYQVGICLQKGQLCDLQ